MSNTPTVTLTRIAPPPLTTPPVVFLKPPQGGGPGDDRHVTPGSGVHEQHSGVFSKVWSDYFALTVGPILQKVAQPQTGTHSARLTKPARIQSSAQLVPNGSPWYESDRGVWYAALNGVWRFLSGTMFAVAAQLPNDLGVNDAGFQFYATDSNVFSLWTGSAWVNP